MNNEVQKRIMQYGTDPRVVYDKCTYDSIYALCKTLGWSMQHAIEMQIKGAVTYYVNREPDGDAGGCIEW